MQYQHLIAELCCWIA